MDYKKKYQLFLGGVVVFLFLSYWLAFGKTWNAYRASQQLTQQQSSAGQAWQQIEQYEQQLAHLEKQQGNPSFSQNYLFQQVTTFCQEQGLSIQSMPESIVYKEQDMQILHNPITVEGAFIPMVKLLYELEQQQHLGQVVSVDFKLGKNYQSRQQELTAAIYLQNIKTISKPQ